MKNLLLAATALIGLASAASAADLPRRAIAPEAAPVVLPAFTWTGVYFGGYAGAVASGDFTVAEPTLPLALGLSAGGYNVGGTVGANYQFTPGSGIVVGVEGDVGYSDIRNNVSLGVAGFGGGSLSARTDGLAATARGRIGYAFDRVMVYGTGGYAYTDVSYGLSAFAAGAPATPLFAGTARGSLDGYTVGGGVEAAFLGNWSAKVEYLYADFDAKAFNFVSSAGNAPVAGKLETHTIKVGVNYRFGGGRGLFGF